MAAEPAAGELITHVIRHVPGACGTTPRMSGQEPTITVRGGPTEQQAASFICFIWWWRTSVLRKPSSARVLTSAPSAARRTGPAHLVRAALHTRQRRRPELGTG
ncbi:hypothetical protein [Streptomyces sp. NRRL S-37]|uniref:hypothetical protein n=1 Tax=Streptomyces sp. NRRL S-37 TaxID=1463903 RepID=UPI00131A7186|nr:hypothetical protein [Streptomyces sp. NRRL S-37]